MLAPTCGTDTDQDGDVDVDDLLAVINQWGPCAAATFCPPTRTLIASWTSMTSWRSSTIGAMILAKARPKRPRRLCRVAGSGTLRTSNTSKRAWRRSPNFPNPVDHRAGIGDAVDPGFGGMT